MATYYKYEATNANGTLKKTFETEREAKDYAQEKLYDYPTFTITPVEGKKDEDEGDDSN